jgi:hypothetical protein
MTAQRNDGPTTDHAPSPVGPFTLMVTPWDEPSFDPTGEYALLPCEPQPYWGHPDPFDDLGEAIRRADLEQSRTATDDFWVADADGNNVYSPPPNDWPPPAPSSVDLHTPE